MKFSIIGILTTTKTVDNNNLYHQQVTIVPNNKKTVKANKARPKL